MARDYNITIRKYNSFLTIKKFLPLFCKIYPKKTQKEILSGIKISVKKHNYSLLVAFANNQAIGIAGITPGYLLYCENFLQLSNLYVDISHRNLGIAQKLINKAEEIAKKNNIKKLVLDSYKDNKDSHKIYHRENMDISAYHFVKEL